MTVYPYHPLANIFPLLEGGEFDTLCDSIKTAGRLHERIALFEDQVLDGRNRQRACQATGITAHYRHFDPAKEGSPLDYVWAMNAARRHLSISQRAMAAADLGKLGWGGDRSKASIEALKTTVEKRAEMAKVGQSTIERADVIKEHGTPELQDAVRQDRVAISTAADIATLPEPEQTKLLGMSDKDIIAKAKEIRARKLAEKQAKNKPAYDADIADGCTVDDLHGLVADGKKYAVIYADPPWDYETYSALGKDRSAGQHYDTDPLAEIKALPVPALAAPHSVLFMWCVDWGLHQALELITAWGFEFKTVGFTWVKQNPSGNGLFMGMGHWTRSNAEMCLLATKGKPSRVHADVRQVVMSPLGPHSQKPDEVRKGIERLVHGPYLELYARRTVPNWTTWGNQIKRGAMGESDSSRAAEAGQEDTASVANADLPASVARDVPGHIVEVKIAAGNASAEIYTEGDVPEEALEERIADLMIRTPPVPAEKIVRVDASTGEIIARRESETLNGGHAVEESPSEAVLDSEGREFIAGGMFDPEIARQEAEFNALDDEQADTREALRGDEAAPETDAAADVDGAASITRNGVEDSAGLAAARQPTDASPLINDGGDHGTVANKSKVSKGRLLAGAAEMPTTDRAVSENRAAPAQSSYLIEVDEDGDPVMPPSLRRSAQDKPL